jgi:hypothetical protein
MVRGKDEYTDPGRDPTLQDVFREVRSAHQDSYDQYHEMSERTARVEEKISILHPLIAVATKRAVSAYYMAIEAKEKISNIKGQWKILLSIVTGSIIIAIGLVIRSYIGV